jgi:hypothetical protein
MRKSDFEILFKDSPEYYGVQNARIILAVNGWVVFHVFDSDTYLRQEMYPTQHIQRIKMLPKQADDFFNINIKRADTAAGAISK